MRLVSGLIGANCQQQTTRHMPGILMFNIFINGRQGEWTTDLINQFYKVVDGFFYVFSI